MGTIYRHSFTPYLELFEPRSAYVSELRLQHAWKNGLWKVERRDKAGRHINILSPGRHNHSDGPDFLDASIMLNGKLLSGDIELHVKPLDWFHHKHHLDHAYDNCILHVVFSHADGTAGATCANGRVLPTCEIPLEEVLAGSPRESCRKFKPDEKTYFELLKEQGRDRVNKKIRYFYDHRLRFPGDVMLYWGLFKACGYRYNEENMIRLFVRFPWAAYCDGLIDKKDILPMLTELAGFSTGGVDFHPIRWTYSRTRPKHFPECRVDWLGKLMTRYYGASVSGMIYEICREYGNLLQVVNDLFAFPGAVAPGPTLRLEMIMNTILPLMEAQRMENQDKGELKKMIRHHFESTKLSRQYGCVKRFHDHHGIEEHDVRRRNWLISQGVLNIQDHYCSQGMQLSCPICLMEEASVREPKAGSQKKTVVSNR